MKKIALALAFLASLLAPAAAQISQGTVATDIQTIIPDNVTGQVTPASVRSILNVLSQAIYQIQNSAGGNVFINTTGLTTANGPGTPVFVWTNLSNNAAGQNMGCRYWVGSNPTTTPGVGDSVVCTMYIDNLNGRTAIWAYNPVCLQATTGSGGGNGINHCVEIDVNQSIAAATPTSAYTTGAVSHAAEAVSSANTGGGAQPPQVAFWVTSAGDSSGTQPWWNFAFSCARTNTACLVGETISGDTGSAFGTAFLWDKTASPTSLLVAGTHTNALDVSGATLTELVNCGTHFCGLAGSGGYGTTQGYLSATGGGASYPTVTNSMAASWNFTAGGGEVDFWNTFQPSSQAAGFNFYQQTGSSAGTLLMTLNKTGGVTTPGLPTSAGGGGLYICVDTSGVQYKKSSCP